MMWAKVQIEDLEDENLEIDFHYPNSKEESIYNIYKAEEVLSI